MLSILHTGEQVCFPPQSVNCMLVCAFFIACFVLRDYCTLYITQWDEAYIKNTLLGGGCHIR